MLCIVLFIPFARFIRHSARARARACISNCGITYERRSFIFNNDNNVAVVRVCQTLNDGTVENISRTDKRSFRKSVGTKFENSTARETRTDCKWMKTSIGFRFKSVLTPGIPRPFPPILPSGRHSKYYTVTSVREHASPLPQRAARISIVFRCSSSYSRGS